MSDTPDPCKKRCKFCGSKHMICKGSGPQSVGRCHWMGLLTAMRLAQKELTTGRYVDRALRGEAIIEQALEKYRNE